jgi:2-polyprenyl-3-methyl-5-hydroxy-6-metoxy-1,4-benzoquinol methylase
LQGDREQQMNIDTFQTEILEVAQSAVNYRKWLAKLTFPFLGDNPLEFGSGIGDYANEWLLLGCKQITVSENSPTRMIRLINKFDENPQVHIKQIDIENIGDSEVGYSAIVSLNVIEHLENDEQAVRNAIRSLQPGGYFIAFTPAFPMLMSKFDKAVGHHRRYTKKSARELLKINGLAIIETSYVNSIGWLAWLVGMRLLKLTPRDGLILKIWDRVVIPIFSTIESWVSPPFGQSILIVGRKSPVDICSRPGIELE